MSKLSISNVDTISKNKIGDGKNFQASVGGFSSLFGLKNMSCNVVDLEPGQKAWPFHLHYGQEEFFVILNGSGSIRYDDDTHPIKEGDVIYTPPGDGTAHQIINSSKSPLRYLAFSTKESPEVCFYPDSGKFGSYFPTGDKQKESEQKGAFIAHKNEHLDYFDGEGS